MKKYIVYIVSLIIYLTGLFGVIKILDFKFEGLIEFLYIIISQFIFAPALIFWKKAIDKAVDNFKNKEE